MSSGIANLEPLARRREQRAWNWYDWANSAYYTTVLTVLFAPYMIPVAGRAAGCADATDTCRKTVDVLGLHLAAGSLPAYLTSFATISSTCSAPTGGPSSATAWRVACCSCRAMPSARTMPWRRWSPRRERLLTGMG